MKRETCPVCGRTVAVDYRGYLFDHNPVKNGGGALFATKRASLAGLCRGSLIPAKDRHA